MVPAEQRRSSPAGRRTPTACGCRPSRRRTRRAAATRRRPTARTASADEDRARTSPSAGARRPACDGGDAAASPGSPITGTEASSSSGSSSSTGRKLSAAPTMYCSPVPATVVTAPSASRTPRSAWLTVSATSTSYPSARRSSSGTRHSPFGSLNRASSGPPSTSPRSPDPMRRTSVSPSASSSARLWCPASATSRCPSGSASALAGNRSVPVAGRGRHVRAVAAVQGALRLVLGDQLADQDLDVAPVPLAGHLRHDVALGVDDDERRPGPRGVRRPGDQLRVVEDGVVHLVPLDGGGERVRVGLVHELRRVHADDHQHVAVLLLQLAQLVQDVQAVDAAERPEVEDDDLAAQVRQGQRRPPVFSHPRPTSSDARTRGSRLSRTPPFCATEPTRRTSAHPVVRTLDPADVTAHRTQDVRTIRSSGRSILRTSEQVVAPAPDPRTVRGQVRSRT